MKKQLLISAAVLAGLYSAVLPAAEEKLPVEQVRQYQKDLPELLKSAPAGFKPGAPESKAAVTAARVLTDMKQTGAAGGDFVYYTVPVFSDLIRMPDVYPADGKLNGTLRVLLTPGEYESASFQIYPFKDQVLEFKVSDLKSKEGHVIPAKEVDLKVVKIWMKGGTAWFCYFADPTLTAVPQLLLHDENLLKVDTVDKANYARLKTADGKEYYRWISPERDVDTVQPSVNLKNHRRGSSFRPLDEPSFTDAAELQAVQFKSGEFKQLHAAIHAPADAKAGFYHGFITVKSGGKNISEIPLTLRVLPFTLPEPKTLYHPDRDFEVRMFSDVSLVWNMAGNGGDLARAVELQKNQLQDLKAHNFGPYIRASIYAQSAKNPELLAMELKMRKDAGYTKHLYGGYFWVHGTTTEIARQSRFTADIMKQVFGHTDLMIQFGDEPGPLFVRNKMGCFRTIHEFGLKFTTAGRTYLFDEGGFIYDAVSTATWPDDPTQETRRYNIVNHPSIGWYACHHVGQENPAFNRRQYGMLTWLNGFTMLRNHSAGLGEWNDLAFDTYKPFTIFYPAYNGMIDTLSYEAFREAIDDMKYFTLLQQEALRCEKSANLETQYTARKALMFLADIDPRSADMETVRMETIRWILKMRDAK